MSQVSTHLEQGRDGERGNAAVDVGDQVLQIQVARSHGCRVLHRNLSEI